MKFDIKRIKELRKKLEPSTIDLPDPVQAFWHDVKNERPPVRKNVLIYTNNGDIAEGEYLGDGLWTQYRWSATLKGNVKKWGYLSDLSRVGTEKNNHETITEELKSTIFKLTKDFSLKLTYLITDTLFNNSSIDDFTKNYLKIHNKLDKDILEMIKMQKNRPEVEVKKNPLA